MEQTRELGLFEVASGTVIVGDPCYERRTWCAGQLAVKKGVWKAVAVKGWKKQPFEVGIDSGQAGLFDDIVYARDDDTWYRSCSAIILKAPGAGVLKNGVVSESGYGDRWLLQLLHSQSR